MGESGFSFNIGKFRVSFEERYKTSDKDRYKIAVMIPHKSHLFEKTYQGFIDTINQQTSHLFEFTIFNAQGSLLQARRQIEDVLTHMYDLIFSLGTLCTLLAKDVSLYKRKAVPIVFTGIYDPLSLHIVDSLDRSGNHLTGVVTGEGSDLHAKQISLMKLLRPQVKNVMIAFDDRLWEGELKACCAHVKDLLMKLGITTHEVHVSSDDTIATVVADKIDAVDVILIFRDTTVMPMVPELSAMCNKRHVTLLASDWYSVERGAALGFASSDYAKGVVCADKALAILIDDTRPNDIPITISNASYKMKINKEAALKQGIVLDEKLLSFLDLIEIN